MASDGEPGTLRAIEATRMPMSGAIQICICIFVLAWYTHISEEVRQVSRPIYNSLLFSKDHEVEVGLAYKCGEYPVTSLQPLPAGFCLLCLLVKIRRRSFVGHAGLRMGDVYPVSVEDATVRKPDARKEEVQDVAICAENCPVLGVRPKISEYLVTTAYEDGTPRKRSTLKISFEEGKVKLALDDHDLKQSIYTVADNMIEGLDMMESALQSDAARWYVWGKHKQKK